MSEKVVTEKVVGNTVVTETVTYELAEEKIESGASFTSINEDSADIEKSNEMTPELVAAEKSLVRKLDFMYVMPCVAILNFLQFFDKSALNYSAVLNIKEDTNITASQFSWVSSIFYLGYLLYQAPNAYFLQKVPLGKYMGILIVLWGLCLTLTFLAKNFSQLAALRFLLGFFEGGIYPMCIMIISAMYRRNEQAGRIGTVYICNGIAMAVGGLVGYGIGHMNGVRNMNAWQWIMIILGSATMAFGVFCFFLLVDGPSSKALILTPAEKEAVRIRSLDNATVITKTIKMHHIWESLKEPRFYCFIVFSCLINLQNGALGTFSSIITVGFGFSSLNAILLTIPSGVVDCIYIGIAIWINRRYGHTLHLASVMLAISIVGLILLVAIPVAKVKLLGLYMCWAFCAAYVLFLTSIANNVNGYTKKIFYSSSVMVLYTIGNFCGPQMMLARQAPLYLGGMIGYMAANLVCIILLQFVRWDMNRENNKRDSINSDEKIDVNDDLTDKENPHFRYRL